LIICLIWLPSYTLADYGFRVDPESTLFSLGCLFVLAIIIIPLVIKNAKKAENLKNYPQIRSKIWTRKTMLINLFGWFIFLLAYEFLFRGLLLFPLADSLGVWPAIAINSSLYAATHIPKGLVETVGALLFGTLICIITIISGSIWTAFMAHLIISWTNSITALKYHPKIHFYSIPKWHQTSF
jgi:membrane protease YdiL (CAAX protease family)